MSEIVNTPVTATAPVVVNGGESALLFDDLTSTFGSKSNKTEKQDSKEVKQETKEETKKESKEAKDTKEREKDLTDDTKKSKAKEDGEKEDKKPVEKAEAKKEELQRKIHKAKLGDKEIDIDDEAVVPVKINGKEELVPVKELLSNYSGKTNWSKQFQDLSQEKKANLEIVSKLEAANEKLKSAFEEKDPQVRLFKMAEIAGVSPMQFRSSLLEDNIQMLEKYYSMSEDEKKADALAFENRYLKHQADTRAQAEARSQANQQLQAKTQQLLASHKIQPEEFDSQKEVLHSLAKEGKLDPKTITPEFVVETKIKDNLWIQAATEAKNSGVQISDNEMLDLVDKAYSFGLGPQDMPEIISDLYGNGKRKKIVEEKVQQAEEFKRGKAPQQTRTAQNNEIWSFDQF